MLSINPIKSAGQAKHYYAQADYYAKGEEGDISSQWFGTGAGEQGLSGSVNADAFKAVLDGHLPDGTVLGRTAKNGREHRAGWDFTLSAPKSVSILALAGGDQRLLKAHHGAVAEALKTLERDYAITRVQTGGVAEEQKTHNLLVAQFTHSTSRAADPQLHTHNVVANATLSNDGLWRSLETRRMYDAAMTVGQVYRAELAVRVKALGYELITNARQGTFDIASVPKDVMHGFSKRREEIEKMAEQYGYRTAKGMDKAAVRTRAKKGKYTKDELLRGWANEMAARGFNAEQVIKQAKLSAEKGVDSAHNNLDADLRFAYKNLAEREAVFPKTQVIVDTLRIGLGQYRPKEVEQAVNELVESGQLIPAEINQGRGPQDALTTPEALRKEAYILSLMERGRGELDTIAPKRLVRAAIANRTLGKGQQQAVEHILGSTDRLIGVQGFAGTGKTYALDTVREVAEKRRFTLLGLAPTASAAQQLEAGSGIKSQTLASHLVKLKNQSRYQPTPKAIWVVDEASLTNANDMADLLTLSRKTHSRVLLVGDRLQLGAIDYGKPFEQMQRAGLAVAEIHEIRRQENPNLLAAVESSIDGKIHEALSRIADHVKSIPGQEARLQALVDDYLRLDPDARERALVLIPDNDTRRQVNKMIRHELQRRGSVGKDRLALLALANRGMTRQEKGRSELYDKGDTVIFARDITSLGIQKDQPYQVEKFRGKTVTLKDDEGQFINWQPAKIAGRAKRGVEVYHAKTRHIGMGEKIRWRRNDTELGLRNSYVGQVIAIDGSNVTIDFGEHGAKTLDMKKHRHWDYGYSSTVHTAQGATVDRAFVLAESWRRNLIHRKSFYVALSRAKHETTIYTDDPAQLARGVTKRLGEKTSALETKGLSHKQLLDRHGLVKSVSQVLKSVDEDKTAVPVKDKSAEKELSL